MFFKLSNLPSHGQEQVLRLALESIFLVEVCKVRAVGPLARIEYIAQLKSNGQISVQQGSLNVGIHENKAVELPLGRNGWTAVHTVQLPFPLASSLR